MQAWVARLSFFLVLGPLAVPASAVDCDLNACTVGDQCHSGTCFPGTPLDCNLDPCSIGGCLEGQCVAVSKCPPQDHPCRTTVTCNPSNGECEFEPANIGGACDVVSNDCMSGTCNSSGDCVENVPLSGGGCTGPGGECSMPGTCSAGTCIAPPVGNGTPCGVGNLCLPMECQSGLCVPSGSPVICPDSGNLCEFSLCNPGTGECEPVPSLCYSTQCGGPGVCNPSTGQCEHNSPLPDGASCDDLNECTAADQCVAGTCTGTGIDNPSMAPVASNASLIGLVAVLAILPAIGVARRRRRS